MFSSLLVIGIQRPRTESASYTRDQGQDWYFKKYAFPDLDSGSRLAFLSWGAQKPRRRSDRNSGRTFPLFQKHPACINYQQPELHSARKHKVQVIQLITTCHLWYAL